MRDTYNMLDPHEKNKAIARRAVEEVWNKHNLAAIDENYAPDIVSHSYPASLPKGAEGIRVYASIFQSAFPDMTMAVEQQIAEGDKVVTRWIAQGTHKSELMGIPATGKQVTVTGTVIYRIAGGMIVESWEEFDQMGMMQQLGVIPVPGQ